MGCHFLSFALPGALSAIISIEIKSSLRQTVKRLILASGKMPRSLLFVNNRKAAALEAACERNNP
jgi:hypothetical protein